MGNVKLIVSHPGFIHARTEGRLLFVYRSPLVHDEDDAYELVKQLLNESHHRVVVARSFADDGMMFGEGLLTIYEIGERFD